MIGSFARMKTRIEIGHQTNFTRQRKWQLQSIDVADIL